MHSRLWKIILLQLAVTCSGNIIRRQDGDGLDAEPQSWTTITTTETLSNSTTTMTTTSSLSVPETSTELTSTTEEESSTEPQSTSTPEPTSTPESTSTPTPSTTSTPSSSSIHSSTTTPSSTSASIFAAKTSSTTILSTTTPTSSTSLSSNSTVSHNSTTSTSEEPSTSLSITSTNTTSSTSSTPSASLRCGQDKGSFISNPAKKLSATNLQDCKSSCKGDSSCKSFEYGTLDGSGNNCWFFDKPVKDLEIGDPQEGFTWAFWDRDCEESSRCGQEGSFSTKPITKSKVSDVGACKSACKGNGNCKTFEYGTTDNSGDNCWLFDKAMWELETTSPQIGFVWRFYDIDCSVSD